MTDNTVTPIHLDESGALIVIHCTDHEWWRPARFHREDAQDAACAHEEREHAMDNHHREARRLRRLRRVAAAARARTYETAERV